MPGYPVAIGGVRLDILSSFQVVDVKIGNRPGFKEGRFVQVRKVKAEYTWSSLFRRRIKRIIIDEAEIQLERNDQGLWNFSHLARGSRKIGGRQMPFLLQEMLVSQGQIRITGMQESGNELILDNIKVKLLWVDDLVKIDQFAFQSCSGEIEGGANIDLASDKTRYKVELEITDFDLGQLCQILKPPQFKISGRFGGNIAMAGKGMELEKLEGNLISIGRGGILKLTSAEKLATYLSDRASGEVLEDVADSLGHFPYDEGTIELRLKEGNLILNTNFRGPKGSFRPEIRMQDFNQLVDLVAPLRRMFLKSQ